MADVVKEQIERLKFDFDEADKDKNGSLSMIELVCILMARGFKGKADDLNAIFAHLDKNKDDKISKEEFESCIGQLPVETVRESAIRKTFQELDKDSSGYVTKEEVMNAFTSTIPADILADTLIYLAQDEDKKVYYEEFLQVLKFEESASYMSKLFRRFDRDGSGFLTSDEIQTAINEEGQIQELKPQIMDLLQATSKAEGEKLNYDEFVKSWLAKKGESIGK